MRGRASETGRLKSLLVLLVDLDERADDGVRAAPAGDAAPTTLTT